MSSSSSDSDSDDLEPIRRIKINIKPKDPVTTREGADIEAIKASVEAWRPLGPRPHPSLSRRQSSLSSVSSLSFGTASGSIHGGSSSKATTMVDPSSANTHLNQYYQQSGYGNAKGNMIMNNYTNNSMRSSPSCSSLVNEFTNRTSFSNLMPSASRTSSPLTFMNSNTNSHSDTVPIALAIQESIELTVKGHQNPSFNSCDVKKQFDTRALGNIKVAFPNSFARLCSLDNAINKESGGRQIPALKLRLHSTENIIRYYASGLVKDSDLDGNNSKDLLNNSSNENNNNNNDNDHFGIRDSGNRDVFGLEQNFQNDPFNLNESPTKVKHNSKVIEFDMDALVKHLKQLYDQSPNMRYYNVDVLRYQIAPIEMIEKCPLQVSAYWKLESKLIKLRLDFKHSNQSGFNLERLREICFIANLDNLIPPSLSIKPVSPNQVSTLARSSSYKTTGNLDLGNTFQNVARMTSSSDGSYPTFGDCNNRITMSQAQASLQANEQHGIKDLIDVNPISEGAFNPILSHTKQLNLSQPQPAPRQVNNILLQMKLPPPPSSGHSRNNHKAGSSSSSNSREMLPAQQLSPFPRNSSNSSSIRSDVLSLSGLADSSRPSQSSQVYPTALSQSTSIQSSLDSDSVIISKPLTQQASPGATSTIPFSIPYITYEPHASWDDKTKKLTWKFDNLLAFYKSEGSGSLLAKVDFRHCDEIPTEFVGQFVSSNDSSQQSTITPHPVDIKFMAVDATLSKISLTIDSAGYRMSLLKKEIRSGRYKSEPCIF